MKTDKSAEEILRDNHTSLDMLYKAYAADGIPLSLGKRIEKAMHEYADQEVAKYKSIIEKLLPLAEYSLNQMDHADEYGYQLSIIDEAKQLIK